MKLLIKFNNEKSAEERKIFFDQIDQDRDGLISF